MAENIVAGLFGLTPQVIQQQQLQRGADLGGLFAAATVNPYAAPNVQNDYLKQQGAQFALGDLGARKLGGLFGLQDPELQKAAAFESILAETQQELGPEGLQNPEMLYGTLASKLANAGLQREATMITMEGQKAIQDYRLSGAKLGTEQSVQAKNLAAAKKDLTEQDPTMKVWQALANKSSPESVKQSIASGYDFALLNIPENVKLSTYGQILVDEGYQPGTPEFQAEMTKFREADLSGKAKGTGNVVIGGISIDSGKLAEAAGTAVGKDAAAIENKYSALDSVGDALSMVDAGINAGYYGPTKQFITKATAGLIGSQEKVENTERFLSYVGNVVIPRLQEFGGNDSVEELKYLRQVMAGETTLEPNSIKRILIDAEKKIKRGIQRVQEQTKAAEQGGNLPLGPGQDRETPVAKKRKRFVNGKWVDE
jgi:hypothetical protein